MGDQPTLHYCACKMCRQRNEDWLRVARDLVGAVDRLGMNVQQAQGEPGALEFIGMQIRSLVRSR